MLWVSNVDPTDLSRMLLRCARDVHRMDAPRAVLRGHTAAVKALAWSPHQANLLATGGGTEDTARAFLMAEGILPLCGGSEQQLAWNEENGGTGDKWCTGLFVDVQRWCY